MHTFGLKSFYLAEAETTVCVIWSVLCGPQCRIFILFPVYSCSDSNHGQEVEETIF